MTTTSKAITLTRESDKIFVVSSNFPYWSHGDGLIRELMAFRDGALCNMAAQAINRAAGKYYMIVSPFGIRNPAVIAAARSLEVGQSAEVAI